MTLAFEKLREITRSRATWVNTKKMKQKPAFKRTWCVQGRTEGTTFVDRRLERAPRRADRCLRAVGGVGGLRRCPASTGSHRRAVFKKGRCALKVLKGVLEAEGTENKGRALGNLEKKRWPAYMPVYMGA